MKRLFLSHSSADSTLATLIASEIEREFSDTVNVFVSSRPDAIPSGRDWFDTVMENLDKADALVILMTEPAVNSAWVGFELGYFWNKTEKERIYPLFHPSTSIPSPMNMLQAKKVTDKDELTDFINRLCSDFGRNYNNKFNVNAIVRAGQAIPKAPPARSLKMFENYIENKSRWSQVIDNGIETWIYEDDVLYHILVDPHFDPDRQQSFDEDWVNRFPAAMLGYDKPKSYPVVLKIAGVVVKQFYFVSLDSARYFVPMPEIEFKDEDERSFYWEKSSLIYKVAKIISKFYPMYPTFESFAERADIEIRD